MFGRKKKKLEAEVSALRTELAEVKNQAATSPLTDAETWESLFSATSAAGPVVSSASAMRVSAVFACVRLISGAIASAPVQVFRRGEDGVSRNRNHPMERMLRLRPNPYMTASTFWKMITGQKILNGNGYAGILRKRSGIPDALIPFQDVRVTPYQAWEIGLDQKLGVNRFRLFYQVQWDDGTVSIFDQDDILHVPNIGWDGKQGLSTIKAGAQAMGLAMAAEESASKLFSNGMLADIALRYPQRLSDEAHAKLREYVERRYSGAANHHTPMILTEGGEAKTLTMNAEDAQLIESRQFSVIDIARFFGVPPVMIGESEKTSSWGSGVEQMARWFTMFTLNDHLTDIEQEMEVKLFRGGNHFAKFDESELTRGDTKTRHDAYRTARGSMQEPGYMTINEIRLAEGLPPVPGGDKLYQPINQEVSADE